MTETIREQKDEDSYANCRFGNWTRIDRSLRVGIFHGPRGGPLSIGSRFRSRRLAGSLRESFTPKVLKETTIHESIEMAELNLDQAKRVYRLAIDATASDAEGDDDWWSEVAKEVRQVCEATSLNAAAAVIEWWHHDWSAVGDSANAAAKRIRQAAKNLSEE